MRKTLTVAAIAAALTIIPVTTALATTPLDETSVVEALDDNGAENHVSTWCEQGVKYDGLSGQTFTIPLPPVGFVWTKLILNGGQDGVPEGNVRSYIVQPVPAVGVAVTRPGAAVSNAILCYESAPATTPAPTPEDDVTPEDVVTPEDDVTPEADVTPGADVSSAGPISPAAAAPSAATPPVVAAQPAAAQPAAATPAGAAPRALPSTGSSSWGLALAALASLVGGLGLVQLSRRAS